MFRSLLTFNLSLLLKSIEGDVDEVGRHSRIKQSLRMYQDGTKMEAYLELAPTPLLLNCRSQVKLENVKRCHFTIV